MNRSIALQDMFHIDAHVMYLLWFQHSFIAPHNIYSYIYLPGSVFTVFSTYSIIPWICVIFVCWIIFMYIINKFLDGLLFILLNQWCRQKYEFIVECRGNIFKVQLHVWINSHFTFILVSFIYFINIHFYVLFQKAFSW